MPVHPVSVAVTRMNDLGRELAELCTAAQAEARSIRASATAGIKAGRAEGDK
jgi:hypothetical protein